MPNCLTLTLLAHDGNNNTNMRFHHFKRLFGKLKKLKIFMTTALRKKCQSGIAHFWIFLIKMSKYLHFLWSTAAGFHHFKRPSSKSKKMKTLEKIVIFWHFTFSFISHPNEQIFIFQVSYAKKCHSDILYCTFLNISRPTEQIFTVPVVNCCWFSSF